MSRLRAVVTVFCLAVLFMAALPGYGAAARSAEQVSAAGTADSADVGLLGEILAWSRGALAWLRALTAPEHGVIVPIVETPPPPPPVFAPAP